MAHRAEEKERLRREREAAEQAAQASADRRKRVGIVGGVTLVAAIAVIAVLAIASGGSGTANKPATDAKIPPVKVRDLTQAAAAAGCAVKTYPIEGRGHTTKAVKYKTNPPTSGPHDPTPSQDGIYAPGNPPDVEQSVHTLEHGRIDFQYRKGTPKNVIAQLTTLVSEKVKGTNGYHSLLFENPTGMKAQVAATAWGRAITCPTMNDRVFDALRAFRLARIDKGPEFIP